MLRGALVLACSALLATSAVSAQPRLTNALGMEFIAIAPGTMHIGKFQPVCPTPQPKDGDQVGNPRAQWN